jgi:NTP pyrophosphatase (non-canonical NTP hydrolase)
MSDLTFAEFSRVNRQRCQRWHPGFPGDDGWTGADWSNAMQGEAGEAGNVVKKLRRIETGQLAARGDGSREQLLAHLADEIGDVFAYLDLLAQFYGLDIARCAAEKFNKVSIRENMPERLEGNR